MKRILYFFETLFRDRHQEKNNDIEGEYWLLFTISWGDKPAHRLPMSVL